MDEWETRRCAWCGEPFQCRTDSQRMFCTDACWMRQKRHAERVRERVNDVPPTETVRQWALERRFYP